MRILFATEQFHTYSGSELVILEAAEFFRARGWECVVAANWIKPPLRDELSRVGASSETDLTSINAFAFDIAWIQHLTAPLLRYSVDAGARERTLFAFAHLSPFTHFETTVTRHEDILADVVLANSEETATRLRELAVPAERISVFHNAAPAAFWTASRIHKPTPRRILVVSNKAPEEIRGAMWLLKKHAEVVHIGRGGTPMRMLPLHLAEADVVITMGKTVQYALAARTPVYLYDSFGGPGYLARDNLERAAWYNFSGRCCGKQRLAEEIAAEVLEGYAEACAFTALLGEDQLARFRLDRVLDDLAARPATLNAEREAVMAREKGYLQREKATAELIRSRYRTVHSLRRRLSRRPGSQNAKADLAVVVLAVNAPPELERAVASLIEQPVALEIVVVNSGGGNPAARLRAFADRIRIVSRDELLLPGAARNVGIASTTAPYVAFLASDCIARPGWARERMIHHRKGASAVASALVNPRPYNAFAVASHLALFNRRLPHVPPDLALRYGASFARTLFHGYGLYREDLRAGEDTEFAARLPQSAKPVWAPGVRTAHDPPTTFRTMLSDQLARGQRTVETLSALGPLPQSPGVWSACRRFGDCIQVSFRATRGRRRLALLFLSPLIACCVAAYTLGMARARRQPVPAATGYPRHTLPDPQAAAVRSTAL